MLSSDTIKERLADKSLKIDPFDADRLQPASYDLTIGDTILVPTRRGARGALPLGTSSIDRMHEVKLLHIPDDDGTIAMSNYRIDQQHFILVTTSEHVEFPDDLAGLVVGQSSVGRIGLAVPFSTGFVDPGFKGTLTFWLANLGPWPVLIKWGMPIAQLTFYQLDTPASKSYDGKYQDQKGATAAKGAQESASSPSTATAKASVGATSSKSPAASSS